MAEHRHSAHAVTDLKYHVIWVTKYRYKILWGDIAERERDLIRQICLAREVTIIRGAISPDHVYVLVAAVQTGAVHQRSVVARAPAGIPCVAQTVLGTAFVGAGRSIRAPSHPTIRAASRNAGSVSGAFGASVFTSLAA